MSRTVNAMPKYYMKTKNINTAAQHYSIRDQKQLKYADAEFKNKNLLK